MRVNIQLNECELLGKGAEGSVYLTPEGYALKVFNNTKGADDEALILNKVGNSRFFPRIIVQISNLIVRECVQGINLYEYIAQNGLSENLAFEIIEFVENLKEVGFTRINIRNAHIFIDRNEKLMIIDPRKAFEKITPYPKDIIKILLKNQCYDEFLSYVTQYDFKLISYWIKGYEYVANSNKISRYEGKKNKNRYRKKLRKNQSLET